MRYIPRTTYQKAAKLAERIHCRASPLPNEVVRFYFSFLFKEGRANRTTSPNPVLAPTMKISRRLFCAATASASLNWSPREGHAAETGPLETFVPCRAITRGPKYHWFGYYDKREFDPTNTLVLSGEVAFEGRSPTAEDRITVGYVDTKRGDRWTPIGTSNAWGWQQGCMLQWIGGEGQR